MTCPNCGADARRGSTYCSQRCAIAFMSAKHEHIRLDTDGAPVEDASGIVQRWLRKFGSSKENSCDSR